MEILLATTNKGKIRELRYLLEGLDVNLLSLVDMKEKIEVVEDGKTFLENAVKKAVEYGKFYKMPVIAEDSGLEVDTLEGLPGVFSARFYEIDYCKDVLKNIDVSNLSKDEKNNLKLLKVLEGKENRKGRYKTVVVFYNNDFGLWTEGSCEGYIGYKPEGTGGFGYDPIFLPEGYNTTMANLPIEEKNKISHRGKALKKLVDLLRKVL